MRKVKAFRTEADGRLVEVKERPEYCWRRECLNDNGQASPDLALSRLRDALTKGKITTVEFSEVEAFLKEHTHSEVFLAHKQEWMDGSLPDFVSERQGSLLWKAGILQYSLENEGWKTITRWGLVFFGIFAIVAFIFEHVLEIPLGTEERDSWLLFLVLGISAFPTRLLWNKCYKGEWFAFHSELEALKLLAPVPLALVGDGWPYIVGIMLCLGLFFGCIVGSVVVLESLSFLRFPTNPDSLVTLVLGHLIEVTLIGLVTTIQVSAIVGLLATLRGKVPRLWSWFSGSNGVCIVAGMALLLAVFWEWSNGFYTYLRILVCLSAAHLFLKNWLDVGKKSLWDARIWLMGVTAVLFNPVIPISLTRSIWRPIDFAAAVIFALSLKAYRTR